MLTMISRGVEISIAGGVGEMVRAHLLGPFFFLFFFFLNQLLLFLAKITKVQNSRASLDMA
jgi:hypothetical protein